MLNAISNFFLPGLFGKGKAPSKAANNPLAEFLFLDRAQRLPQSGTKALMQRSDMYAYQNHAVEFVKTRPSSALWIDMGLGKTAVVLTAFADLQASFDVRRMLVIAPLRIARKVWKDEIQEWAHLRHLTISNITGTREEKFKALRTDADIHTINREETQWLEAQFIQDKKQITRWPWDLVVLDESQSFRSQGSQRFNSLARLRSLFPRMVQLTGTPSPNGYMGLWSQLYLLDKGRRLGSDQKSFRERHFTPPVGIFTKWSLKPRAAKAVQSQVSDIVLSLREQDYLTLPPVKENFVKVSLPASALAKYKEMERELIASVKGKKLTAVNAGVLDNKLLQMASGAIYHNDRGEWVELHDAKIKALEEVIEGMCGKRLLVSYSYKHELARISKLLEAVCKRLDLRWSVLSSDADFNQWAGGAYDVGVLHPASAGHGLNDVYKSGCEDIVHFSLGADLELYQQVNGRIAGGNRRKGRNVVIHHIVAEGTRDMDYARLIKRKALSQDELKASLAIVLGEEG